MVNPSQKPQSEEKEPGQVSESQSPKKKDVEDIFAASANANVRLTPVDPKLDTKPANVPSVTLADNKPPIPKPVAPPKKLVKKGQSKKVMLLMIVFIVVIGIFGASYVAFLTFSTSTGEPTSIVTEEAPGTEVTEQPIETTPVIEEVVEEFIEQDSDSDGLTDERELELGLNILLADTDGDALSDKDEVDIYLTDPFDQDTDGDGFSDGSEVRQGYNPNGPGALKDITKKFN